MPCDLTTALEVRNAVARSSLDLFDPCRASHRERGEAPYRELPDMHALVASSRKSVLVNEYHAVGGSLGARSGPFCCAKGMGPRGGVLSPKATPAFRQVERLERCRAELDDRGSPG